MARLGSNVNDEGEAWHRDAFFDAREANVADIAMRGVKKKAAIAKPNGLDAV
jgi:hypothetical protein